MTTRYDFDARIPSALAVDSQAAAASGPLPPGMLSRMQRYWQAANYLTVAQIYLLDDPLLREPLRPEHIKPRLLGHWGTSPRLSFIYIQLNRLINERDANVIYLTGPGHGGPALVAQAYLEGTYSEIYPQVSRDVTGLWHLCRRFSTPGGIPSHVSVQTPGSIHEGGELGYVLAHAFGAALDNPDLLVAAVVGDGEAESGPLAGAWKSTSFLNPACDGAVLPILHLNGYKISGPTVLGRDDDEDVRAAPGQRLRGPLRRGRRSTARPRGVRGDARPLFRAHSKHPGRGSATWRVRAAALARHRAAHTQGLNRAKGRRRLAGGGHFPSPPGVAHGAPLRSRSVRATGGVAEQLTTRRIVRHRRKTRVRRG